MVVIIITTPTTTTATAPPPQPQLPPLNVYHMGATAASTQTHRKNTCLPAVQKFKTRAKVIKRTKKKNTREAFLSWIECRVLTHSFCWQSLSLCVFWVTLKLSYGVLVIDTNDFFVGRFEPSLASSTCRHLFFGCSDFRSALRCLESSGFNECPSLQLYFSQRTADKRKHKEILERGCADLPELQGGDSSAAKGDFERNPQVKRLTLRRGRRITSNETRYVLEPKLLSISESSGFSFFFFF